MKDKIIFCDIDGTLMDGFRGMMDVSDKTMYALTELKNSAYIVLTSGRAKCMLPNRLAQFKPDGYILSNGAYIETEGVILRNNVFDQDQVDFMVDYSHHSGGYCVLVNQKGLFTECLNETMVTRLLYNLGIKLTLLRDLNKCEKYNFMIEICKNETNCELFANACKGKFNVKRQYRYTAFDVNRLGETKGDAVSVVLKQMNMDSEHAYCFGDSENDLEMMRLVQYSVAMGNADAIIKNVARVITEDVLNDGFYNELVRANLVDSIKK